MEELRGLNEWIGGTSQKIKRTVGWIYRAGAVIGSPCRPQMRPTVKQELNLWRRFNRLDRLSSTLY